MSTVPRVIDVAECVAIVRALAGLRLVVLLAVACAVVAGCSGSGSRSEGGFGVPRQPAPGAFAGKREAISGVISVQPNGCVDLDMGTNGLRWAVWPSDAAGVQDGVGIALAGVVLRPGARLTGTGALADPAVLPGWPDGQGSYFGAFGRFCRADALGVVVLDEATISFV